MMAVNQEVSRPPGFQNPIQNLNMAVLGYLVPPSPPPPLAFMINDPEEVAVPEENVQELVNALDNVALNQPGINRDSSEAMESTRRL